VKDESIERDRRLIRFLLTLISVSKGTVYRLRFVYCLLHEKCLASLHKKNGFTEVINLTRYKFENNFARSSK